MKKALFEAAFVVLGVVLALAANEWRESLARRHEARVALASIVEELEANRASVEASARYHREHLGTVMAARQNGAALDPRQFDKGFIMPAQLSHAAWDSASETGALANMKFEKVLALGRVYAAQEAYQEQTRNAAAIIYNAMFEKGVDAMTGNPAGLASMIGAFQYRETQLAAVYAAALGGDAPEPAP